jgi:uncharacterized protein (DUF488 family)
MARIRFTLALKVPWSSCAILLRTGSGATGGSDSSAPIAGQTYYESVSTCTLYTIGHSTHSIEEFLALLKGHGVEQIADVRSIPKSRHCPQFNIDALGPSLLAAGIGYTPIKALGGRRHSRKNSINTGWRNASFRGYADYMATPAFSEGLDELTAIARRQTTAIMCAEAVPWRCHRSLIADAMMLRGWEVLEIISAQPAKPHKLTPFLKVVDGRLTYPVEEA